MRDDGYLSICRLNGTDIRNQACNLIRWKDDVIEAPSYWWNVYWSKTLKSYYAPYFSTYAEAADWVSDNALVARVYGAHWSGVPRGRMDEPGKNGVPEDA